VLFGASGTLGFAAFGELWRRREQLDLVVLLRRPNAKRFARYVAQGLNVEWGDATSIEDVRRAVRGADVVLNAMAVISPAADYHPDQARAVNVDAVSNIVTAISEEQDGLARIRLVHTSTVGLTGDRLPPLHWGRVGDPLNPSILDTYALGKMAGERLVLESGIRHLAVLRMTFIMPTNFAALLTLRDPIMFHMPLETRMEMISSDDAGLALANAATIDSDSAFWGRVYNVGGGPGMRTMAQRYQDVALQLVGLRGIRHVAERNWFATRNFHLQYFADSAVADQYLQFQRDDIASYLDKLRASTPRWVTALRATMRFAPLRWISEQATRATLRRMATKHRNGPVYWVDHGVTARLDAFFGGLAEYRQIPDWDDQPADDADPPHVQVVHGYDDTKAVWTIDDLRAAAEFRGGRCAAAHWDGQRITPVDWECARGHRFHATPNTVLHAGHWCVDCAPAPWRPAEEARINPYFAQVWPYGAQVGVRQEYNESDAEDIVDADR